MAITSHGFTGAVNNVQWAAMAGSLGFDYVARGASDCKVSSVSAGTRTVRVATGVIAGGGVVDYNDAPVDIPLPNVTSGSKWFMVIAKRVWQTTNATTFTFVEGSAIRQLPGRDTGFGDEDDQPLALVRIAAGQTIPAEIIDLRVVGSNNGVMVGFDTLCLDYLPGVGTVVRIGAVEYTRSLDPSGVAYWAPSHAPAASRAISSRRSGNDGFPPGGTTYIHTASLPSAPAGLYRVDLAWHLSNIADATAELTATANGVPIITPGVQVDVDSKIKVFPVSVLHSHGGGPLSVTSFALVNAGYGKVHDGTRITVTWAGPL